MEGLYFEWVDHLILIIGHVLTIISYKHAQWNYGLFNIIVLSSPDTEA